MTDHERLYLEEIKTGAIYSPFEAIFAMSIRAENYLGVLLLLSLKPIIEILQAIDMCIKGKQST